jgi:formamidopyrimidine-DNA glycosylase
LPELPEVEVLRRSLERPLVGRRIEAVAVRDTRLRESVDAPALATAVGRRVESLGRRSKYLLLHLERGRTVVIHLGMSGRLTIAPADATPLKHEHVAFGLEGGERLRFVDPRRFGLVFAQDTGALVADPHFASLGVEPLEVGPTGVGGFAGALLRRLAAGRRGPVKTFLMDAGVVVGVGNIYASEALFEAGIHPRRSVARVSARRWDLLAAAVREVLGRAIAQGGTTLNDFVDGEGNAGYFQVSLRVYDRAGEPCVRCGTAIRRIVLGGRSTYFCPRCQR